MLFCHLLIFFQNQLFKKNSFRNTIRVSNSLDPDQDGHFVFHAFLSSADFFSKLSFSKNSFRNTIRVSNSLDPDQAGRFVGPDLESYCLQVLSADVTRR